MVSKAPSQPQHDYLRIQLSFDFQYAEQLVSIRGPSVCQLSGDDSDEIFQIGSGHVDGKTAGKQKLYVLVRSGDVRS